MMAGAYDETLLYAPEDLDLYGKTLVDKKKLEEAEKVFDKLEKDYPIPPNTPPEKVGRTVGTAHSIAMAGKARILQAKGQAADGQKILEEMKRLYPWSPKLAEADYGIGAGLYADKKFEEAIDLLAKVAKNNAAPVHLRAQSMMLIAKSGEELKRFEEAINNYIKIGTLFESERELASEGLWRGGQLMEKQVTGEIKKPAPPAATAAKPAGAASKPGQAGKKPGEAAPKPGTGPVPPKA
jgi:tetratricopeptide (TPR) repeat protein